VWRDPPNQTNGVTPRRSLALLRQLGRFLRGNRIGTACGVGRPSLTTRIAINDPGPRVVVAQCPRSFRIATTRLPQQAVIRSRLVWVLSRISFSGSCVERWVSRRILSGRQAEASFDLIEPRR
jgi:hypothetical protein